MKGTAVKHQGDVEMQYEVLIWGTYVGDLSYECYVRVTRL